MNSINDQKLEATLNNKILDNPNEANNYLRLAVLLDQSNRLEDVYILLEKAKSLDPLNYEIYNFLGSNAKKKGEIQDSINLKISVPNRLTLLI